MKLTFYGTGASEGVPAVFCECESCVQARKLGGRNLRTRTSARVDDHVLIDFSVDSFAHVLFGGLRLSQIHLVLITHSHLDHFFPDDLLAVDEPKAHLPQGWHVNVYGNQRVGAIWQKAVRRNWSHRNDERISFQQLSLFQPVEMDGMTVTPLKADHIPGEECFLYRIERQGRSLLYAHDTHGLPEETWQALRQSHLDCVVLDCTSVMTPDVFSSHMSFQDNVAIRRRMLQEKIADEKTIFIATHFAHTYILPHSELQQRMAPEGFIPAYDGLCVEF